MLRPFELFVALRHLRSRNRNRFVSFISLISVVGIALSVAVLIVVLAVMNGFDVEVRSRILNVIPHATITGLDGHIEDWPLLSDVVAADEEVVAVAPFVDGQGMLVGPGSVAGVQLRGIEPEREKGVSNASALIGDDVLVTLASRSYRIVIGEELARRIEAKVGDKLILMTTQGAMTPAGMMPRMRRFEVAGIFSAGMYEFDRGLVYMNVDDAARVMGLRGAVSGVSLSVQEPLEAYRIVREGARRYGGGVYVSDWTREHANFFRSIELTKSIIFMILLLVVAVAAFNIVSTLVMVVREKRAEIAILRSMGASSRTILVVFMLEGSLIGVGGTVIGLALGLLIAFNLQPIVAVVESVTQMQFVAPDVYFISELPSDVEWGDVWRICAVALVLAILATVYPAFKAARANPAVALRHE